MATNIASALVLDPTIADRIVVLWIGGHPYYWEHARDFNLNQDRVAAKVLFDSGVPLVHIPSADVAAQLSVTLPELEKGIRGKSQIADELYDRVAGYRDEVLKQRGNAAKKEEWSKVIWDIATIAWLVDPQHSVQTQVVQRPSLNADGTWKPNSKSPPSVVRVATDLNAPRVFELMFEALD
ncbi:ribonucleoside hydrolase 1 [Crateriforma conspicua]|uniref:Ribonucleoside hydrolase 1 n=2 Tax=Crateriforma conspicua TaxID=2527996 RepID=A0A5C6FMD2_9PLAN|nr:ribonucleoside hydrolase 1 [Crateriforma conspicua]